jgi:gamma-glutamyl-gamma-aminobutyrate hydrolase PuuD
VTYAVDINPRLDRSEIALIKDFTSREQGSFFGICRGHQLAAVTFGHELIQDIPKETNGTQIHREGWHMVSGDGKFFDGLSPNFSVLSYHHQAVLPKAESPLLPLLVSTEGGPEIIEAFRFKNDRGLTFQFHPEGMKDKTAEAIGAAILKIAGGAPTQRAPIRRPNKCVKAMVFQ